MTTPTQVRRPWRASLRTGFAVIIALAAMTPSLVAASGLDETLRPVAGALAIAAAITRIMALPAVDEFLARFLPWLAADPDPEPAGVLGLFTADPAVVASVVCPVRACNERFEIPVTATLWGSIPATDSGCIEVTRPASPGVDQHIRDHVIAGTWPTQAANTDGGEL